MKSIFAILLIIAFCLVGCNNKDNIVTSNVPTIVENDSVTPSSLLNNLAEIMKKGFEVIDEQSFNTSLKNWGKVKFISGYFIIDNLPVLDFYLVDDKNNILYNFPEFDDNSAVFNNLITISFTDVNRDGYEDAIIIGNFMRGQGENSGELFPITNVYFQKGKEFVQIPELNKQINDAKQNDSVDNVMKFVSDKDIKLDN